MVNLPLIAKEFSRLKDQTYLDHAGATLYADSQINNAAKDLTANLYLNPHTSKHTSDAVDQIRSQILHHFNTNDKEYTVIFTSGSTAALKLVSESFTFNNGAFVYLQDNHTSVLGMREVAASKNASVVCIPHKQLFETLTNDKQASNTKNNTEKVLFVYPAMCNFSGYKYPLEWIEKIKNCHLNSVTKEHIGKQFAHWSIMLDTAAFVSTNYLDLSKFKPDFICVSFYKLFGFPTGIGALIVKDKSAHLLDKSYYGGGTVEIAISGYRHHVKRSGLSERFEDGTIPFLSILSLKHGFDTLSSLILADVTTGKTVDSISHHTFNLAQEFYQRLNLLKHYNNTPVVCIYADTDYSDIARQGGIVNFNLLRANGDYIGYSEVTFMCQLFNIHLRSGCFCNPGACQRFLKLSNDELLKHHNAGHVCGDNKDLIDGTPTGSLRASFGYMSNTKDVDNIIQLIVKCFVETTPQNCDVVENTVINDLSDDFNEQMPLGILREIDIFPLKSCAPFKISSSWEIGSTGFKYDREWMIVTEKGVALSQKQDTRICLIKPSIDLTIKKLILSFPGVESIHLPLDSNGINKTESSLCHSKVCGDNIIGYDCGDEVAEWLLNVLGIPGLRLIKQSQEDPRTNKSKDQQKSQISLANQAQFLVINLTSVRWLANRVETQEFHDRIDNLKDRFRGNFIIETKRPFEEFAWKNIAIDGVDFQVDGPCRRCQMVCIDQETGEKTVEPLRTISKHFEGKLNFGIYLSFNHKTSNEKLALKCGSIIY